MAFTKEIGIGDCIADVTYNGEYLPIMSIDIKENILDPFGPKASIYLRDVFNNFAFLPGNEKDKIIITFTDHLNNKVVFDMRPFKHVNMHDATKNNKGSGKYQVSELIVVTPEYLANLKNPVQGKKEGPSTTTAKSILQGNLGTTKNVIIGDSSTSPQQINFTLDKPSDAIGSKLNGLGSSSSSGSAFYVFFQSVVNGIASYTITTFNKLMQQKPQFEYVKRSDAGTGNISKQDLIYSIMGLNVDSSFDLERRIDGQLSGKSFNLSTGQTYTMGPIAPATKPEDPTVIDRTVEMPNPVYINILYDKVNTKNKTNVVKAQLQKAWELAKYSEVNGMIRIYGNGGIQLGSLIDIDPGDTPNRLQGKGLVTAIQHQIADEGISPRYVQNVAVVPIPKS
jgi:hypothetical protein